MDNFSIVIPPIMILCKFILIHPCLYIHVCFMVEEYNSVCNTLAKWLTAPLSGYLVKNINTAALCVLVCPVPLSWVC